MNDQSNTTYLVLFLWMFVGFFFTNFIIHKYKEFKDRYKPRKIKIHATCCKCFHLIEHQHEIGPWDEIYIPPICNDCASKPGGEKID